MTLFAAYRAFLLADGTVTAVTSDARPHAAIQHPPDNYILMRDLGGPCISNTLSGAGALFTNRMELTVWSKNADTAAKLATYIGRAISQFNGLLGGGGGVKVQVTGLVGPRSIYNMENLLYGSQVDVLSIVDQSTVS